MNIRHGRKKLEAGARLAVSLLYPPHCPACDRILPPVGRKICRECAGKLPYITGAKCVMCGRSVTSPQKLICEECRRFPRHFDQGTACFYYEGNMREAVLRLKQGQRREYAWWMGECLADQIRPLLGYWHPDLVVPVPVSAVRKRERGYNQAELLAAEVCRQLDLPLNARCLRKKGETKAQKELTRAERRRNLSGIFNADQTVNGKRVLVIDDVFTTGSTMDAVTDALRAAGAARVYSVCFCIVP